MVVTDPHQLSTQRVAQLYRHAGRSFVAGLVNALLLAGILWPVAERQVLGAWLAAVLLTSGLRLVVARIHAKPGRGMLVAGRSVNSHLGIGLLIGLAWGSAAVFLWPAGDAPRQLLLILVLGVTAAGGLAMFLALPGAYAAFLASVLGPLCARLLLVGGESEQWIVLLLAALAASLLVTGRAVHASVMEALGLYFNFQNLASLDGLTQIPNRRQFDLTLAEEWNRAARNGVPLSLILIDVDHFKAYNDHYGHQAGDECLKQVAQALAGRARRAGDLVARYGGEEFVVLLYHTPRDEGWAMGESLRLAVRELDLPHVHSSAADVVTVSVGGATLVPTPEGNSHTLVELADEAVYGAKSSGRDRVVWAGTADLPHEQFLEQRRR